MLGQREQGISRKGRKRDQQDHGGVDQNFSFHSVSPLSVSYCYYMRILSDCQEKSAQTDFVRLCAVVYAAISPAWQVPRGHLQVRSVRTCTLLDKPSRREVSFMPDYVGCEIPDEFVVGYGLDYAERYRALPFVGILKPEVYTKK